MPLHRLCCKVLCRSDSFPCSFSWLFSLLFLRLPYTFRGVCSSTNVASHDCITDILNPLSNYRLYIWLFLDKFLSGYNNTKRYLSRVTPSFVKTVINGGPGIQIELEFISISIYGSKKTREPGEKPWRKARTNNKLNPHEMPSSGIEPGSQVIHCTTLSSPGFPENQLSNVL